MSAANQATPARALILTVYGAFVRQLGGWLAVSDLVTLLDDVGQPPPVVRSATSRLKKAGLLAPETREGIAGYALTDVARAILRDGDDRIFASSTPAEPDDGWVIAVFSVPERHRDRRHQLRSRLTALGFGQVAPGVWIAPRRVLVDTQRQLARHGLDRYVSLFDGHHLGFDDTPALVRRTWDLTALARAYDRFDRVHRRVHQRWEVDPQRSDRQAFADYVTALTEWRRLPYRDPGLPAVLLPSDWPGERARATFATLVDRLEDRALSHVLAVVGDPVTA